MHKGLRASEAEAVCWLRLSSFESNLGRPDKVLHPLLSAQSRRRLSYARVDPCVDPMHGEAHPVVASSRECTV